MIDFEKSNENHVIGSTYFIHNQNSVDHLSSFSLKQYFTYCSNFPYDFLFYKEDGNLFYKEARRLGQIYMCVKMRTTVAMKM